MSKNHDEFKDEKPIFLQRFPLKLDIRFFFLLFYSSLNEKYILDVGI